MRVAKEHGLMLGPSFGIVPISHFSRMKLPKDMIESAWRVVAPSVEMNMTGRHPLALWQVIAAAYLEGLSHGAAMMKDKEAKG